MTQQANNRRAAQQVGKTIEAGYNAQKEAVTWVVPGSEAFYTYLEAHNGSVQDAQEQYLYTAIGFTPIGKFTKGATTVFRSFTSSNFRHNLGKLIGNIPTNSQAHHVFPQANEFSSFFSSKGINIHDPKFGSWWNSASHGKNADQYNAQWRQWISNNPNATSNDVMNYGRQIMEQYGLPVHY